MRWINISLILFILFCGCSSSQISLDDQREAYYSQARLIKFEETYVGDGIYYTLQVDWTGDLKTDVIYCYTIVNYDENVNPIVEQLPYKMIYYRWVPTTYMSGGETYISDKARLVKIELDRNLDGQVDSVWNAGSKTLPKHILLDP